MIMGPAPMIMIELISVLFGMVTPIGRLDTRGNPNRAQIVVGYRHQRGFCKPCLRIQV